MAVSLSIALVPDIGQEASTRVIDCKIFKQLCLMAIRQKIVEGLP